MREQWDDSRACQSKKFNNPSPNYIAEVPHIKSLIFELISDISIFSNYNLPIKELNKIAITNLKYKIFKKWKDYTDSK